MSTSPYRAISLPGYAKKQSGKAYLADGFGIEKMENYWCVSIYIANVFLWLETLGLWKSLSSRVSTIYLPDRKRPMLPTILSDNLCSLQENQTRFAFALDVVLDDIGFKNVTTLSFTLL